MNSRKYTPVKGSILSEEEAHIYGTRLSEIEEENNGVLTPDLVLQDAANEASPLHEYFEWDDEQAAHRYRKSQAGYLLRSINVVLERGDQPEEVRAFVNLQYGKDENTQRGYISTEYVLSDVELRKQMVEIALKDLEAWRRKYAQYSELAEYFAIIDRRIAA